MNSADMTRDEKVRALVRVTGMPELRAKVIIDGQERSERREAAAVQPAVELRTVSLPLDFTLPWSCLVSDNRRYTLFEGRMKLSAEYAEARRKIKKIVRAITGDELPLQIPLSLTAKVYVPDRRPRDCPDFSKGCHDALKSVIYTDDVWLYDARWTRAGVDVDRPRADITIEAWPE